MKYLTIEADINGTGIRDDFNDPMQVSELNLNSDLEKRLEKWLKKYQQHIRLMSVEKKSHFNIQDLDGEGVKIAKQIKGALKDEAKICYYSDAQGFKIPI